MLLMLMPGLGAPPVLAVAIVEVPPGVVAGGGVRPSDRFDGGANFCSPGYGGYCVVLDPGAVVLLGEAEARDSWAYGATIGGELRCCGGCEP